MGKGPPFVYNIIIKTSAKLRLPNLQSWWMAWQFVKEMTREANNSTVKVDI